MDSKIIQRIDGVLKSINEVIEEMNGISFDAFLNNRMLMGAVSFGLIQIGERMVKLEQLLRDKYPELPWSQARKMRNIIVHDYENANQKTIYDTAINDLEVLEGCFLELKTTSSTFLKTPYLQTDFCLGRGMKRTPMNYLN